MNESADYFIRFTLIQQGFKTRQDSQEPRKEPHRPSPLLLESPSFSIIEAFHIGLPFASWTRPICWLDSRRLRSIFGILERFCTSILCCYGVVIPRRWFGFCYPCHPLAESRSGRLREWLISTSPINCSGRHCYLVSNLAASPSV